MRRFKEENLIKTLRLLAPGTLLRLSLESILSARSGALIVVGGGAEIFDIMDGGFKINSDMTPANLYELAKMDGAIIISEDIQKILFANVHLNPDTTVYSSETGIRHRTAERVAKQTGQAVVSISQRRNIITFYKGHTKYVLRDMSFILNKANQALQTLEKYKNVLDQVLTNLSALEFENIVTLTEVLLVLQRAELVMRIAEVIERYIIELGVEGRLIKMQLEELLVDVEEEIRFVVMDYFEDDESSYAPEKIGPILSNMNDEDLLGLVSVAKNLGFPHDPNILETRLYSKGYRILHKIPRLPLSVVENLINSFDDLKGALQATLEELDEVEGIGEVRARAIKKGLQRIREQALIERQI